MPDDLTLSANSENPFGDASPFEGAEKLLEAWFVPSEQELPPSAYSANGDGKHGLRRVERKVWNSMLDEVQCKILSVVEGDGVDAYLLSLVSSFLLSFFRFHST